jgi:hypothetical protein
MGQVPVDRSPRLCRPPLTDYWQVASAGLSANGRNGRKMPATLRGELKRLAQVDRWDSEGFAVFRNGAPCDHESLLRQQFGYAAV